MKLFTLAATFFCCAGHVISRSLNLPAIADSDTACKGALRPEVVDSDPTYVISPNFDGITRYPAGALCVWTLRTPPGKVINLAFEEFSLQDSLDCVRDRLALYAGESLPQGLGKQPPGASGQPAAAAPLVRWCGPLLPRDYALPANTAATLVFSSGKLGTPGLGFVARYYLTDAPVGGDCKDDELKCRNGQCAEEGKKCDGNDDCGDGTDEEGCGYETGGQPVCGQPFVDPVRFHGDAYIVGGSKAKPEGWPWQASLRLAEDPVYGHKCGASLLDRQWLVSAAHCFRTWGEPSDWVIYVGKHYLFEDEPAQQFRYAESIFVHPGYQMTVVSGQRAELIENRKDHDIALIKLNAPVTLNRQVQPICLEELGDLADNTTCYVTGWGATREAEVSPELKQASVLVLPLDECSAYYNGTCVINSLMYCAGYADGRHDSCHGDSGGPLVVKQGGKWKLAGVVSGGLRCGEPRHPGIYTKVAPHLGWMRDVMSANSGHP